MFIDVNSYSDCCSDSAMIQAAVDAAAAVTDPDSVTRCGAGGPR